MTRPRLLDLFCGAGGAAMGYHRAGFDVTGVDIKPQPRYPFEFHQADALTFPLDGFDAIHASPPCQAYSTMTKMHGKEGSHPDLVDAVRNRLGPTWTPCECGDFWCAIHDIHAHDCECPPVEEWKRDPYEQAVPYVIENVSGAPMDDAPMFGGLVLCGSMFGLQVRRHRKFEVSFDVPFVPPCRHSEQLKRGPVVAVYGNSGGSSKRDGRKFGGVASWRKAMGVEWMNVAELREAIPPAYTEFIGAALLRAVTARQS